MARLALFLALCAIPAAGQVFTLGTPSDPCKGGNPLTIANSTETVRWGDFSCAFPVTQSGPYTVQLGFLEPCFAAGACAAGQVTKPGQRILNVLANDQPVLSGFDPFAAGATNAVPATRTVLVYPAAQTVTIRIQTVLRSGVLASVTLSPQPNQVVCGQNLTCTMRGDGTVLVDTGTSVVTKPTLQSGVLLACVGTGSSASADKCALPWPLTAYTDHMIIGYFPAFTNTGAFSLAIDSLPAVPVKIFNGGSLIDPPAGMFIAGYELDLTYSAAQNAFYLPTFPTLPPIARSVCVGSGTGWDCTGLELYRIANSAFTAVAATPAALALPACPVTSGSCWKPAVLGK